MFALRGPNDGKASGKKRRRWNDRHQVTWQNDMMAPNMRSYFDRHVPAVDKPSKPRPRLRPTWSIDIPEMEPADRVYRVFDARTCTWKEQTQWAALPAPPPPPPEAASAGKPGDAGRRTQLPQMAPSPGAQSAPQLPQAGEQKRNRRRPRTPRTVEDLRRQRQLEEGFDKGHGVVFSRWNDRFQVNCRSYFDRWREDEGKSFFESKHPTWRLEHERKTLFAKSESEPSIRSGPEWVSKF